MDIAFAIQSYRSDALPVSAQRCVNAYAEAQVRGSKKPVVVFGFPGIPTFATVGRGPIRGVFEMNGVVYVVSGTEFYSVSSAGAATLLGTALTGSAPVSMDGNGTQVIVVNGSLGYTYTVASATFAQIADGQFNAASTVTFIDSYFVLDWSGTNKFFISDLLDGTSYAALMFASAESSPDRVLSVINNGGVLLIFGEKTIEAWNHTGAISFPFQRFEGQTVARGILAPLARVVEDSAAFFLGNDRVFYRLAGTQPTRLSTHAIEKEWETYTTVSDAFCFTVPYGGHKFIYVTFPSEGKTWGVDIATQLWHERISWDASGAEAKWRINCAVAAYNKILVGDANSGKIGYLDPATHTEFGDPVRFILVAPSVSNGGKMGFMPMFEADMDVGVGITTGQGSDPQAMLDWSDDGGKTWVSPQLWRTMGALGNYQTRLQWDGLGSFYQRTLRLQVSDPVKRVLIAARCPGLEWEA